MPEGDRRDRLEQDLRQQKQMRDLVEDVAKLNEKLDALQTSIDDMARNGVPAVFG